VKYYQVACSHVVGSVPRSVGVQPHSWDLSNMFGIGIGIGTGTKTVNATGSMNDGLKMKLIFMSER
jgi:hypothetical protein